MLLDADDPLLNAVADALDGGDDGISPIATRAADYYNDPVRFADECIVWPAGRGLTSYQRETLAAIPTKRRVSVRGPHGLGKTTTSAIAILWFALTRDAVGRDWKCVTTAGAWRQLERYLWPEVRKWARLLNWDVLGRLPFNEHTELLALNLKLRHGSAFAVASDNPELIEGAHGDSVMYVFDESKAISTATFDAAEGAFSGAGEGSEYEAYALAMSTPGEPNGRFYDIHRRAPGLDDWWPRHVTKQEAIDAGRITEEWCNRRREQWGDSAVYFNRVEGEFHSSDEDGVIPLSWVELANERWRAWDEEGRVPPPGLRVVGVDVARSGADKTVMALRYGDVVTELRYTSREDTMQTTGRVAAMQRAVPNLNAIVDVIGIGAGVVDRLREQRLPVDGFNSSQGTSKRDKSGELGFVNFRSAAWWNLREILDPASGINIALPPDDLLTGDLTAPHWRVMSGGKIQIESKDDIHKRIGRSTDSGDACLAAGTLVDCERGPVPIESIRPGDRVWTRRGLRTVLVAGLTRRNAPLVRVELEDGRRIVGTGSHPVWDGESFRPLDSFVQSDSMWVCAPTGSHTTASLSPATRTATDVNTASTTGRQKRGAIAVYPHSTSRSTKPRSDPSRTAGTSTTETKTRWTTGQKTWKHYQPGSTRPTTPRQTADGVVSTKNTWPECANSRKTGIGRRRVERGTPSTGGCPGSAGNRRLPVRVSAAVRKSVRSGPIWTGAGGVPGSATWRGRTALACTAKRLRARVAARRFGGNVRVKVPLVPVRVVRVSASGTGDVWNLTVDGAPEFFANGVLTHNCVMSWWQSSGDWTEAYGVIVCDKCGNPYIRDVHPERCPRCQHVPVLVPA